MSEHAEVSHTIPSSKERLENQQFDYLLVFGQGPVQEADGIPKRGHEGLNVYSRLLALAASQMFKDGIVQNIILSGGQTGIRAGMPEAKSEAELMRDIIKRHLRDAYDPNRVFIENESKDTLQNFTNIIQTYFDPTKPEFAEKKVAMLGIGFHAHDTHSGAGIGRLEKLGERFQLNASVYSAEHVLQELVIDKHAPGTFVSNEFGRLTDMTLHNVVSRLKSRQEKVLVEMLDVGDWLQLTQNLSGNEALLRKMTLGDAFVMDRLMKGKGFHSIDETKAFIQTADIADLAMDLSDLYTQLKQTDLRVLKERYARVKGGVFHAFEMLSRKGTAPYHPDIFTLFGKGEDPRKKEIP